MVIHETSSLQYRLQRVLDVLDCGLSRLDDSSGGDDPEGTAEDEVEDSEDAEEIVAAPARKRGVAKLTVSCLHDRAASLITKNSCIRQLLLGHMPIP